LGTTNQNKLPSVKWRNKQNKRAVDWRHGHLKTQTFTSCQKRAISIQIYEQRTILHLHALCWCTIECKIITPRHYVKASTSRWAWLQST